jgi:transcriptional regulator with XRE-family HTH domain
MADFSERLRTLRKEKSITQYRLAKETGISAPAIASYECGRNDPGAFILCCLADYFGVTTDYLLGRTDKR